MNPETFAKVRMATAYHAWREAAGAEVEAEGEADATGEVLESISRGAITQNCQGQVGLPAQNG
jgi:hypothetical protein